MRRALELLLDRLHHARMRVADVHHADAAREVDVPLAADIPQLRSFRPVGGDRMGAGDAAGNVLRAKLCELGFGGLRDRHAAIQADTIRAWWKGLARPSQGYGLVRPRRLSSLGAASRTATSR